MNNARPRTVSDAMAQTEERAQERDIRWRHYDLWKDLTRVFSGWELDCHVLIRALGWGVNIDGVEVPTKRRRVVSKAARSPAAGSHTRSRGKAQTVYLPHPLVELVDGLVETGRYGSFSEVVREGLRLIEAQETAREQARTTERDGQEHNAQEHNVQR